MPACKSCGMWCAKVGREELCPLCEQALGRLAGYAAPVVHGRWIARYDGPYMRRRCYCSKCGEHSGIGGIPKNQEKPYCPNCGAKMDGESDE